MSNQPDATTIPRFDVVGLGLNAMDYIAVLPRFPEPGTSWILVNIFPEELAGIVMIVKSI